MFSGCKQGADTMINNNHRGNEQRSDIENQKGNEDCENLLCCEKYEGLSAELEQMIISDWIQIRNWTDDNVRIEKYYGTYSCSVVVLMGGFFAIDYGWSVIIAGTLISNPDARQLEVWRGGRFYQLEEAYNRGFLTQEDIRSIAYIQQATRPM